MEGDDGSLPAKNLPTVNPLRKIIRPAEVGLLVWKSSCAWVNCTMKHREVESLGVRLGRLVQQSFVKKLLSCLAQWEQHAKQKLVWKPAGSTHDTGINFPSGWWEISEDDSYQISIADAVAAMIHALKMGGSAQYGGVIENLTTFVKDYTSSCRLSFPITLYTDQDRRHLKDGRDRLQRAFEEVSQVRRKFQVGTKVLITEAGKRRADAKNFDNFANDMMQKNKLFEDQVETSKMVSDAALACQNVHTYQQLSRIFSAVQAVAKELDDTHASVSGFNEEELSPGSEPTTPRNLAAGGLPARRNRWASAKTKSRLGLLTRQEEASEAAQSNAQKSKGSAIKFEDEEAHAQQLQDLMAMRLTLKVKAGQFRQSGNRFEQLAKLMEQGHEKLVKADDDLKAALAEVKELEDKLVEDLTPEAETWLNENLDKGKLPHEMAAHLEVKQESGPTAYDRDELRQRTNRLRAALDEVNKVSDKENKLKTQLEELVAEIEEINSRKEDVLQPKIDMSALETTTPEAALNAQAGKEMVQKALRTMSAYCTESKKIQTYGSENNKLSFLGKESEKTSQTLCQSMQNSGSEGSSKDFLEKASKWKAAHAKLLAEMADVTSALEGGSAAAIKPKLQPTKPENRKNDKSKKGKDAAQEKVMAKLRKEYESLADQFSSLSFKNSKQKALNSNLQRDLDAESYLAERTLPSPTQKPEQKKKDDAGKEGVVNTEQTAHIAGVDATPWSPDAAETLAVPIADAIVQPDDESNKKITKAQEAEESPGMVDLRQQIAEALIRRADLVGRIKELEHEMSQQQGMPGQTAEAQSKSGRKEEIHGSKADSQGNQGHGKKGGKTEGLLPHPKEKPGKKNLKTSSHQKASEELDGSEEESSESSEEEQIDPWIEAFPGDEPSLAKQKYDFCLAQKLDFKQLHNLDRHKTLKFKLQRGQKQWRRNLALKKKLLLKFLTGDERQMAEAALSPGSKDLIAAKHQQEVNFLHERVAMIDKLLSFWRRRMASFDAEISGQKKGFRSHVATLLEGIRRLAQLLGASARPRRKAVLLEDTAGLGSRISTTAFLQVGALLRRPSKDKEVTFTEQGQEDNEELKAADAVKEAESEALAFLKSLLFRLKNLKQKDPRAMSTETTLSDSLTPDSGGTEILFRHCLKQILDLPAVQHRVVTQHLIGLERTRLLQLVKKSMIHQARDHLEACQRVLSCLQGDPDEMRQQMHDGGPLFPEKVADDSDHSSFSDSDKSATVGQGRAAGQEGRRGSAGGLGKFLQRRASAGAAIGLEGIVGRRTSVDGSAGPRRMSVGGLARASMLAKPLSSLAQASNSQNTSRRNSASSGEQEDLTVDASNEKTKVAGGAAAAAGWGRRRLSAGAVGAGTGLAQRLKEAQRHADQLEEGKAVAESKTGTSMHRESVSTGAGSSLSSMMMVKQRLRDMRAKHAVLTTSIGDSQFQRADRKLQNSLRKHGLRSRESTQGQWHQNIGYDNLREEAKVDLPRRSLSTPGRYQGTGKRGTIRSDKARGAWTRRPSRLPQRTEKLVNEWEQIRNALASTRNAWITSQQLRVSSMLREMGATRRDSSSSSSESSSEEEQHVQDNGPVDIKAKIRKKINRELRNFLRQHGTKFVSTLGYKGTLLPPPTPPILQSGRYTLALTALRKRLRAILDFSRRTFPIKEGRGRCVTLDKESFPDWYPSRGKPPAGDAQEQQFDAPADKKRPSSFRSRKRPQGSDDEPVESQPMMVLSPWTRQNYEENSEILAEGPASPFDFDCWLQPVVLNRGSVLPTGFLPKSSSSERSLFPAWSRSRPRWVTAKAREEDDKQDWAGNVCKQLADQIQEAVTETRSPRFRTNRKNLRSNRVDLASEEIPPRQTDLKALATSKPRADQSQAEEAMTFPPRPVFQGFCLNSDVCSFVVSLEEELRLGMRDQGRQLEELLGVPLTVILQTALVQDPKILEILIHLDPGAFSTTLKGMLSDLEMAYLGAIPDSDLIDSMDSGEVLEFARPTTSGSMRLSRLTSTPSGEAAEAPVSRPSSVRETVDATNAMLIKVSEHPDSDISAFKDAFARSMQSRPVLAPPSSAESMNQSQNTLSLRADGTGLEIDSRRSSYIPQAEDRRSSYIPQAEGRRSSHIPQAEAQKPQAEAPENADALDLSREVEDEEPLQEQGAQPCLQKALAEQANWQLLSPEELKNRSTMLETSGSRVELSTSETSPPEAASAPDFSGPTSASVPTLAEEDPEHAFKQHFQLWRQWREEGSVPSGNLFGKLQQTGPAPWSATGSQEFASKVAPEKFGKNKVMKESVIKPKKKVLASDTAKQAGIAKKESSTSKADMRIGKPLAEKGATKGKRPKLPAQESTAPVLDRMKSEMSPTTRSLNEYLNNFQHADMELLLSDISRPGTSASSRPGTQGSRPGTRGSIESTIGFPFLPHWSSRPSNANLPIASSPEGMPCWPNLSGWQGSKPSTADPKATVNSASTALPSLPGSSGFASLPGSSGFDVSLEHEMSNIAGSVSSTGESWRRALTSRSESPWKERLARVSPEKDSVDAAPLFASSSPRRSPSRASPGLPPRTSPASLTSRTSSLVSPGPPKKSSSPQLPQLSR